MFLAHLHDLGAQGTRESIPSRYVCIYIEREKIETGSLTLGVKCMSIRDLVMFG